MEERPDELMLDSSAALKRKKEKALRREKAKVQRLSQLWKSTKANLADRPVKRSKTGQVSGGAGDDVIVNVNVAPDPVDIPVGALGPDPVADAGMDLDPVDIPVQALGPVMPFRPSVTRFASARRLWRPKGRRRPFRWSGFKRVGNLRKFRRRI